jgi:hypothetical protein
MGSALGLIGQDPATYSREEGLRHLARVGLDEAAVQKAIDDHRCAEGRITRPMRYETCCWKRDYAA